MGLADEGMRFTDAHSPSAVCTPTRYGLLTGRYAWRTRMKTGVLWTGDRLLIEPGRETIASMLKEHGYGLGEPRAGEIARAAGCAFALSDPAAVSPTFTAPASADEETDQAIEDQTTCINNNSASSHLWQSSPFLKSLRRPRPTRRCG